MRNIWKIARQEVKNYFISPMGYIVLALFSVLAGWFFFHRVSNFNQMVIYYRMSQNPEVLNQLNLNTYVIARLFKDILMLLGILIPAVTMRVLAEEKKQKTLELLLTAPLHTREIVIGKFCAVMIFVGIMLALTLIYPALLFVFGEPRPDIIPILIGYAGLVMVGSCIASVGIFASSLTENQIVAFVVALFITQLFFIMSLPAAAVGGVVGDVLRFLSLRDHFSALARAFVDTRVIVYYGSFSFVWLYLTHRIIEGLRVR